MWFWRRRIKRMEESRDVPALLGVLVDGLDAKGLPGLPKCRDYLRYPGTRRSLFYQGHDAREAAHDALIRIGADAVEPLVRALRNGDSDMRCGVADMLGEIGDARAARPLSEALRDGNCQVRRRAAQALGRISDAESVDLLCRALNDQDRFVREHAARALRSLSHPSSIIPLCDALEKVAPGEGIGGRIFGNALSDVVRDTIGLAEVGSLDRVTRLPDSIDYWQGAIPWDDVDPPYEFNSRPLKELAQRELARRGR